MKKTLTLLTLAFFCTLSFAQEKRKELPKVAVYIMDNPQDSTFLKDAVSHALNTSKKYSVVALDARAAISAEQKRQHSGEVKEADIAKLGEASGADFVCTVRRSRGNLVRVSFVGVQSLSEVSGRSWMLTLPLDADEYEGRTKYVETEIHETLGVLAESKLAEAQKETLEFEQRKAESQTRREFLELEKQKLAWEAEKQRLALEAEKQRMAWERERKIQEENEAKEKSIQVEKASSTFSSGDRWKTFGLNFIPGLGSAVIMQDWVGAGVAWGVTGVAGLVGAILISGALDAEDSDSDGQGNATAVWLLSYTLFNLPWNIYRSSTYDKPIEKTSLIDPRNFNLFAMPSANPKRKSLMPGVFYNVRF